MRDATARIGTPVVVQPMLSGSAELLAGVVQDPVFGPLVAFGPGGVFAELIGQAEFRIAPLTDADAEELVTGGKAGQLVRGFRGQPAADEEALADLLHRLARLGDDLPEVAELDLNPVIAGPDGCVAVDARIRVARPGRRAAHEDLVAGFPQPFPRLPRIPGAPASDEHRWREGGSTCSTRSTARASASSTESSAGSTRAPQPLEAARQAERLRDPLGTLHLAAVGRGRHAYSRLVDGAVLASSTRSPTLR